MTPASASTAQIAEMTAEELQAHVNLATGVHCQGRNWEDGEKAACIQRARELNVKIEGL